MQVTDPNGATSKTVYDGLGRTIESWQPSAIQASVKTTFPPQSQVVNGQVAAPYRITLGIWDVGGIGGPLAEGTIEDGCIICPWHQSTFDLATGNVAVGPSAFPQPCLPTRVRDGKIEIGPPREPQR